MRILRLALARCRALVRRDVVAGEIRDEMQFHLQMRAEEYEQRGLEADDARRAAARRFGSLVLMQDRGYDVRGGGMMETVLQDVRYGVRLLLKHRASSSIAILTLAVGIGVSTALFSVIDAALLRPLPYPNAEQLVDILVHATRDGDSGHYAPSMAEIRAWRESGRVLAQVGAGRVTGFPRIVDAGQPERLIVGEASEDFLEVYGVKPLLGRGIQLEDAREGAPLVALLGHGYWQSRFGGTPDVIGRIIRIAGAPATIVGVLPAGFYSETAVWQPERAAASRLNFRGSGTPVRGRLRPGITFAQAERELTAISMKLPPDPDQTQATSVRVELTSLYDEETGGSGRTITPLACAVSLILLIACVNVAGLLLARGAIREPELAVRASIGAGRARLVRQLLTESLVLSLAGGLVGLILAWTSLDALVTIIPMSLPTNSPAAINLPVLGFTAVVSVASAVVFGLMPALRISRVRMGAQLAVAGRRHGSPLSRGGGQLLIAAEVALAVVLLAGAGLMIRSFARLVEVDLGFDPDAVLTMEVEPIDPAPGVREQYYPALLSAFRTLPELAAAGAVDSLPMRDGLSVGFVTTGGQTNLIMKQILPGYFEAIGLPVKLGRRPTESDRTGAEQVVLINEEAARLFFPGGPPVGKFLNMLGERPRRIIGVVGNVRHSGPLWAPKPEVYLLYGQTAPNPLSIVLRPRASATLSADRLLQMARAVGPQVLVGRIRSGSHDLADNVATPRHRTLLLSLLGGLGMLLTLVGIFSMTAYAVARRTQEIGIRMAFGAGPADVVRAMVRDAAWPALLGLAVGMAGAFYATRLIASFLFETTSHDPVTFAAVAVLMGVAALVAAWVPARRAARVDPVIALRAE
ncbi:MAG: FtsX-like permease family protein [Luteitalea sp.]|nr:FtsX-like permease family protein [Luteitalea sp.]